MAYDDVKYLADWRDKGEYPKIHDRLWKHIGLHTQGESYVDLCGNHGMLAQRVIDKLGKPCILIEADTATLRNSKAYGTTSIKYNMRIQPSTYALVQEILMDHKVDTMIARRCISELFTSVIDRNRLTFAAMLADAGVRQLFLQGRQYSARSTHPLPSINEEIQCFTSHYTVKQTVGQCAMMEAN